MSEDKVESFINLLGITIEKIEKTNNIAKGSITLKKHHGQAYNTTHGGVLFP